jgi:hypothetical protein
VIKRVTGQTTLGELAVLRAQYGVTRIRLEIDFRAIGGPVLALLLTPELAVRGRGKTDAEAIDDAFGRLAHRTAAALQRSES